MLKILSSFLLLFFVQAMALVRVTASRRFGKPGGGYYAAGDEVEVNDEAARFLVGVQGIAAFADKKPSRGSAKKAESKPDNDDLPEDFPARALLIQAGFDTVEKVKAAGPEKLLEINGIGDSALAKIRDALNEAADD